MKRLAVLFLLTVPSSCRDSGPLRHLTRLQAFYCSEHGRVACDSVPRGVAIPRESLPPADEAFQVWAWHPGKGKVVYRVEWRSPLVAGDSTVADKSSGTELAEAGDSSTLSYNFAQAAKTRYVLRVLLETPNGKVLDQDSLVWDYGGARGAEVAGGQPGTDHPH